LSREKQYRWISLGWLDSRPKLQTNKHIIWAWVKSIVLGQRSVSCSPTSRSACVPPRPNHPDKEVPIPRCVERGDHGAQHFRHDVKIHTYVHHKGCGTVSLCHRATSAGSPPTTVHCRNFGGNALQATLAIAATLGFSEVCVSLHPRPRFACVGYRLRALRLLATGLQGHYKL
jgi:hypothetical protein